MPAPWPEVERLFHEACERRPQDREAFLRRECSSDEALYSEVLSLLAEANDSDTFLDAPAHAPEPVLPHAPTASLVGRRLHEYEVQAWLGAGGMGEVYRARDVRLGRDVAIKVLPSSVASDADRVARFRREAQILATLNQSNIGAIYALVETDEALGLVLELVEGPTLAERLRTGPMSLREVLHLGLDIASALEAAHVKGVVHRDLKPANIKLTPHGAAKVLDFGLAKATTVDAAAPTVTELGATRDGVILGTAPYMSPEQVRGLPVGPTVDIWAFGCVLYEALTGTQAFPGPSPVDCLAAILERDPDWTALPSSTPEPISQLLRRCFEKNPERRLPDIRNARALVDDELAGISGRAPALPHRRRFVTRAAAGLSAVVALAMAGSAIVVRDRVLRARPMELQLTSRESIVPTHSSEVALSPDGRLIAYASVTAPLGMPGMSGSRGRSGASTDESADESASMTGMPMTEQIYLRARGDTGARPIGGAVGSAPFFSSDGQWLGFWHAPTATLRKVAVSGGAPVKIADAPSGISGATWGPDGTIVFAWFDLFTVSAGGGNPTILLKVDEQHGERFYRHPSFLPSGKYVLFTVGKADTESYDEGDIAVVSLDGKQKKTLPLQGTSPRYVSSGYLIYARDGKLLAVRFDPDALELRGQPFPVIGEGVFMSTTTGMAAYAVSSQGDLVYASGPVERSARQLVWVDRAGAAAPLPLPPRPYLHPRLSPDDAQLAVEVEGASHDIYSYEFRRGVLSKLTIDGASHWPSWSPHGDRLTFRSWKTGTMTMWDMPADRSAPARRLTDLGSMQSPESWSPDGRTLAFTEMDDAANGSDIYILKAGDPRIHPLVETKFSEGSPKFSPDGKWMAYASNESGHSEVYVIAYMGPGAKIQISNSGGTDPVWSRDMKELFYRNGDLMMAVEITRGPRLRVGKPAKLWDGRYDAGAGSSCGMTGPSSANYDVSRDGRFLMVRDLDQPAQCKRLRDVPNWAALVASSRPQ